MGMSLEGKTVVITGASGIVGSGILEEFVRAGATVIAPVRGRKDALLENFADLDASKLDVVEAIVSEEQSVSNLAKYIKEKYGSVDHVVTSVGGWWQGGPLLKQPTEDFLDAYRTYVLSHYFLAKYLLPVIRQAKESSFTFLTGGSGEAAYVVDASFLTAHVAGLYGVIMCIQAEYQEEDIRVNELRLAAVVRRHQEENHPTVPSEIRHGMGEFSHRLVGKAAVALALDASGGNRQWRIARPELEQLEKEG